MSQVNRIVYSIHLSLSLCLPLFLDCRCGKGSNKELVSTKDILEHGHLPDCTSDCQLDEVKGIEVGPLLSLDHPVF